MKSKTASEEHDYSPTKRLLKYSESLKQRFHPDRKILVVQAPQFLFDAINLDVIRNRGYYAYPPTGLQWLATSLAGRDMQIDFLDLNLQVLQRVIADPDYNIHSWLEGLDEQLERSQPSIIAVSCLTVNTDFFGKPHPLTDVLAHLMKKNRYVVLAGGPTASNEIRGFLERDLCHFVVDGEGEYKLNYLIDCLLEEKITHTQTSGIFYFHEGNVHESDGLEMPVKILGNLIESYRHISLESYCKAGCLNPYSRMTGQENIYGVFQLHRGCRCNCAFCGVRTFMGKGVRSHPVSSALEEIRYLVEERGVRHFEVLDDDFLAVPALTLQFLKGLSSFRQKFRITWAANNGLISNALNQELLEAMKASGCIGFKIGIEAGDPEILRKMKKPGTPASFKKIGRLLQDYPEFFVGGNYIIGFFGRETFSQMMETYRLSVELNLDWSSFAIYQVTNKSTGSGKSKKENFGAIDFIPTKSSSTRELRSDKSLPLGPEVFSISGKTVPSREMMNNIWLTFNLVGNYIGNKHLKPGGDPAKFLGWISALRISYPENPYMALFAGLGQIILGNREQALADHARCSEILEKSESWQYRFDAFRLSPLVRCFPGEKLEAFEMLTDIGAKYVIMKTEEGEHD